MNRFFIEYKRKIFSELDFNEMTSLLFTSNQLFDCSAKLHFRSDLMTIDSNYTQIDDCFRSFDVLISIVANQDFGICYTFFRRDYKIYIKDKDYMKIVFKNNNLFI